MGSTPIAEYIYGRGASRGKRVHAFGGAKNNMVIMPDADMDQTVDALIGAGYGSAGQRCMAISVVVPVGDATADRLMEKLVPRVEALKISPSTDASAGYGPMITQAAAAWPRARRLRSTGRLQDAGLRGGLLPRLLPVRPRDGGHADLQGGDLPPVLRAKSYDETLRLCNDHEYGNGVAIFTRDGDAARDFVSKVQVGMVGVNVPIPTPLAYHSCGGWKRPVFGDLNQHGADAIRFYTKSKNVTARSPSGVKEDAEVSMPTIRYRRGRPPVAPRARPCGSRQRGFGLARRPNDPSPATHSA